MTIPVHVALVDETGKIPMSTLTEVAGALNEQIQSDFAPIWHVKATVGAYEKAPPFTWRIIIKSKVQGALGYHTDEWMVPVAYVDDDGEWSVTVSHELLEMLADPWGNRMHTARHPEGIMPADVGLSGSRRRVQYLLEVCDPPEAAAYEVGGVLVSDFLLPDWYRTHPSPNGLYSFQGTCTTPRQVAQGGYVSFSVDGDWWQLLNFGKPMLANLGRFDRAEFSSLRAFSDDWNRRVRDTA